MIVSGGVPSFRRLGHERWSSVARHYPARRSIENRSAHSATRGWPCDDGPAGEDQVGAVGAGLA